jgi:hypothetical protein
MDGRKCGPVPSSDTGAAPRYAALPAQALAELNARLLGLRSMKGHDCGFAFERFLSDLFGLYRLDPPPLVPFGRGADRRWFRVATRYFLLEAKWQDPRVGQAELLTFAGEVDGKAQWSQRGRPSRVCTGQRTGIICVDGLNMTHVLSGRLDVPDVLQRKKRRAAETGRAFVPVRELFIGGDVTPKPPSCDRRHCAGCP